MLALSRKIRCSLTVNVDQLKPFHARADDPPTLGPMSDPGQEGKHELELLLDRTEMRWVLQYHVRWRGHTSADNEWLWADSEELAHCPERVTVAASVPRRRGARRTAGALAVPAGVVSPPCSPGRVPVGDNGLGADRAGGSVHPVPLAGAALGPHGVPALP
jgi:hypothetical protein